MNAQPLDNQQRVFLNNLYVKFHDSIVRFLRSRVKDEETAQDLAQDVWLKLTHNYGDTLGYNPENTERTWLFNYVYNTLVDHYRTDKASRNNYVDGIEGDEGEKFEFKNEDTTNPVEKREKVKTIRKAIHNLNPKEQKIATMFYLMRLKQREIAEFLELPLGSVTVTVSRLKTKLQTTVPLMMEM